jgi:hypothetical protein
VFTGTLRAGKWNIIVRLTPALGFTVAKPVLAASVRVR